MDIGEVLRETKTLFSESYEMVTLNNKMNRLCFNVRTDVFYIPFAVKISNYEDFRIVAEFEVRHVAPIFDDLTLTLDKINKELSTGAFTISMNGMMRLKYAVPIQGLKITPAWIARRVEEMTFEYVKYGTCIVDLLRGQSSVYSEQRILKTEETNAILNMKRA